MEIIAKTKVIYEGWRALEINECIIGRKQYIWNKKEEIPILVEI